MERFQAGTYEWLMFAMRRRQGRRLAALNERDSHLARSAAVGQQVRPGQGGPGVPRSRTAPPLASYPNASGVDMWERDPYKAPWRDYVGALAPNSLLYKEFRQKFRLPKEMFDMWLDRTKMSGKFRYPHDGISGRVPKPLENKLMAVFRVLAIGCPFDAVEEAAGMDKETIRSFLH